MRLRRFRFYGSWGEICTGWYVVENGVIIARIVPASGYKAQAPRSCFAFGEGKPVDMIRYYLVVPDAKRKRYRMLGFSRRKNALAFLQDYRSGKKNLPPHDDDLWLGVKEVRS